MKILLGKISHEAFNQNDLSELFKRSRIKSQEFQKTNLDEILNLLDAFSQYWLTNSNLEVEAFKGLKEDIGFSPEMIQATLKIIPELFKRQNLEKRIKAEIGRLDLLDNWCHSSNSIGKIRAFPIGQLLHVTAGNVFISCIDSLIMGFLTKNISHLKLSSKNQFFPFFIAKTFIEFDKKNILADKFSILGWKGGDETFEIPFKQNVQGIVAWGGEEMLLSLKKNLPLGVKLFDYGPKISFQVLTLKGYQKEDLTELASKVARDLIMWDQQACSSPQNLFYEEGIDLKILFKALEKELNQSIFPRGEITEDEAVELLKEKERARYTHLMQGTHLLQGKTFLLIEETKPFLQTSPLNRTLIFKKFTSLENLLDQISPFRFYLQSCGYQTSAFEKDEYLNALSSVGIKRFAPMGNMSQGYPGLPHDGKYGMNEFISYVSDEVINDEDRLIVHLKTNVPYFKDLNIQKFTDLPFTSAELIAQNPLVKSPILKSTKHSAGRIFASGGSTGNPKNVFYSHEDWLRTAKVFSDHFKIQGPQKSDKVANLFATGSLYSSFLAVDRYLEELGVEILPLGGLGDIASIVENLKLHRPNVIMGLPSLIVSYAEFCEKNNIKLEIHKIYFAGEHFSEASKKYLEKIWHTNYFCSAGYATVDAGMIGFQCSNSEAGVHHILDEAIQLEIIDEEIIVTSYLREGMPVVRYKTGDRGEWVSGVCGCLEVSPRFKLLGRIDSQINIWSCRIHLNDLEKAFISVLKSLPEYQIKLRNVDRQEKMEILVHDEVSDKMVESFYALSDDAKKTISFDVFKKNITLKKVSVSDFTKNNRTGKTTKVIDQRQ